MEHDDINAMRKQQPMMEHFDYFFKIMLIGDSGVGKTSLMLRYTESSFYHGNYISTIGVDFRNKIIDIDSKKVKLQIWDTAGQERFRSITHAYYRDANALILTYSVGNRTSFQNHRSWLSDIKQYAPAESIILLLANKSDINTAMREVSQKEGEMLAAENDIPFLEASAQNGINVTCAFEALARLLISGELKDKDEKYSEYEGSNKTFELQSTQKTENICCQC